MAEELPMLLHSGRSHLAAQLHTHQAHFKPVVLGAMPGWRYTLRIPSWSQVELSDGELVVFFQVEVTVLPPDDGPPRKRSVGRRYSNFTTLFQRLREEVGPRVLAGLDPPPKRSFSAVNKKPELIERRRWELEQWLWRLTEVPQIANSAMMFHFCELDAASRLIGRQGPQLSPTASVATDQHSGLPSYAPSWSGSETSEHTEAVDSEAAAGAGAGAGAGAALRSAQSNHLQQQQQQQPQQRRGDSGHLHVSPSGSSASMDSGAVSSLQPGASGDALAGVGGRVRLGLHVEQRAAIRGLVKSLRSQLQVAATDMQDAARSIQGDQEAIAQLAAQVQQLQEVGGSPGERGPRAGDSAAAAEGQAALLLQRERERAEGLELELQLERERAERLAAQLAAAQEQQPAAADTELRQPAHEQQRHEEAAVGEDRLAELGKQLEQQGAALTALQQELDAEQVAKQGLLARASEAEAATAALIADKEAAQAKFKSDLKVLAREVKGLRQQLAAEQQRSAELAAQLTAQPTAPVAAAMPEGAAASAAQQPSSADALPESQVLGVLRAVAALRSTLGECRVDMQVPEQQGMVGVAAPQASLGALADCARRLRSLQESVRRELMVEQQEPAAGEVATASSVVGELRGTLGGLLLDAAEARRRYYELLRSTLAVSAHLDTLQQKVVSPSTSPMKAHELLNTQLVGAAALLAAAPQPQKLQLPDVDEASTAGAAAEAPSAAAAHPAAGSSESPSK